MNQWTHPTQPLRLVVARRAKIWRRFCLPQSRFRPRQVFQCLWHLCAIIDEEDGLKPLFMVLENISRDFSRRPRTCYRSTTTKCLEDSSLINANYSKEAFIEDVPFNITHTDFRARDHEGLFVIVFCHRSTFCYRKKIFCLRRVFWVMINKVLQRLSIFEWQINELDSLFWCLLKYRKDDGTFCGDLIVLGIRS